MAQEWSPLLVMGEHRDMKHIWIREKQTRTIPYILSMCVRRVTIVGVHLQWGESCGSKASNSTQLILC